MIFGKFLHGLSRESRDTLFILALVAWIVFSHPGMQAPWGLPLAGLVLIWRTYLTLTDKPLPKRGWTLGILLVVVCLSLWSFKTILGKEAGVSILVTLIALKTLEMRAGRDAFVIFFLGFFLLLTHFFYSQTISMAFVMMVSVWGLLTALVLMHMPVGQPALKKASVIAAKTALLGTPVMVALFLFFPRIAPLWGVPQDGRGSTGLSDKLFMGAIAELAQNDEIVMRLRFPEKTPSLSDLYFRGPVLSQFDGIVWSTSESFETESHPQFDVKQNPLKYEITLEPQGTRTVPLLEVTPDVFLSHDNAGFTLTDDLRWRANKAIFERLRMDLYAVNVPQYGPTEFEPSLSVDLQLPIGYNPRTIAWAKALSQKPDLAKADSRDLANAVMNHIRQENFQYTLTPGIYGDNRPQEAIDEFWMDRRQGFCEHFASAFVFIMRSLGVPARIVTGYQGADPQPVDGYYVVRKSSAHAWAEYWVQGRGWLRADPTVYVAPDRIQRSVMLRPPRGLVIDALQKTLGSNAYVLTSWRQLWELTNNRWNQWVLNYSAGQQIDMLKNWGFSKPDWTDLVYLWIGLLVSVVLIFTLYSRLLRRTDPWSRDMSLLRQELRRLGLTIDEHDPPLTLSKKLLEHLGPAGQPLANGLVHLDRARYGQTKKAGLSVKILRQLRATAHDWATKRYQARR